jgi:hypothetical protein
MQVIQECAAPALKSFFILNVEEGGKSGNFSAAWTNLEISYVVPIWIFQYGYFSVFFSIIYGEHLKVMILFVVKAPYLKFF